MKLYYFDIYGRAEPIRMLLNHAKHEFEDVRLDKEGMEKLKAEGKLEFGQLPLLETADGKYMVQSQAILRALGMKFGYYPTGTTEADIKLSYLIDSTIDAIGDVITAFAKANFEQDEEKKKGMFADLVGKTLPSFLEAMNKRKAAGESENFFHGDHVTIADFAFGAFVNSVAFNEANPHAALFAGFINEKEALKKYVEHLNGHILAEHLAARPKPRPY